MTNYDTGDCMPINVYTGLMRSGKSYEVVSEVIVPAIRNGRDVVTNVDGISEEKIHEYLKNKYPKDGHSKYGSVKHVTNAQVFQDDFLPYYDDEKNAHIDTIVKPGDLVAIDEAWRFWGDRMKIKKNHQSFILEHGHFTHAETNIACDMVLMIQSMGTLNRFIKDVVAFSFRTTKKVSLGFSKMYSLNMWEGKSMTKANHVGQWTRTYKKEIFPLYSSFKGGAEGVLVNADRRQNIWVNWKIWGGLALLIVGGWVGGRNAYKFFHPVEVKTEATGPKTVAGTSATPASVNTGSRTPLPATVVFSEVWRITGTFYAQDKRWVVLSNPAGAVRVESPSMFHNSGLAQTGDIDGAKVSAWSGAPLPRSNAFGGGPAPGGQGPLDETKK
jgi:zona occludens toxin